jgi:hypothetical protein
MIPQFPLDSIADYTYLIAPHTEHDELVKKRIPTITTGPILRDYVIQLTELDFTLEATVSKLVGLPNPWVAMTHRFAKENLGVVADNIPLNFTEEQIKQEYLYLEASLQRKEAYLASLPMEGGMIRGFHGSTTRHLPLIEISGGIKPNMPCPRGPGYFLGVENHIFFFLNDPSQAIAHAQARAGEIGLNKDQVIVASALLNPDELKHDYIHPGKSSYRMPSRLVEVECLFT